MTETCPGFETLVDYWADDLADDEVERIDAHVLGCDRCAAESTAVARIVHAFRGAIPPVVGAMQVRELADRGVRFVDNFVAPGGCPPVRFPADADVLLHRLGGLDLAAATRVRVVVRSESSGVVMYVDEDAPFDRERGEVLIACQRHFASLPPDVLFEVQPLHAAGADPVVRYSVPHVLDV